MIIYYCYASMYTLHTSVTFTRTRGRRLWGGTSHTSGGRDAQAAFRELMAAAPRVIIDYGKPYDGDFEFRPNELTPRHFKCVGEEEDCNGPY